MVHSIIISISSISLERKHEKISDSSIYRIVLKIRMIPIIEAAI